MKKKLNSLIGFKIGAIDGEIGKVKEFYFDDKTWTIRYLVVETGSWLFERKILLSPKALTITDWAEQVFYTNLTIEQIKNSPNIDTDKPVSMQQEMDLYNYYPWGSYYWGGGMWAGGIGTAGMRPPSPLAHEEAMHNEADSQGIENDTNPHLRSTSKIIGYNIKAADGDIGDVDDFIINDQTWAIDFMQVDTGNWFPGKKVLIAPKSIREINWMNSSVVVNATEKQVKNSPEYVPSQEVSDSYEANLQNYYGKYLK